MLLLVEGYPTPGILQEQEPRFVTMDQQSSFGRFTLPEEFSLSHFSRNSFSSSHLYLGNRHRLASHTFPGGFTARIHTSNSRDDNTDKGETSDRKQPVGIID